jgi:UDP-N-acetylmuramoyl-L-alanyl-D-glutamate--2,6-diaminopimelate ligase
MKLLKDLLYKVRINRIQGSTHVAVDDITTDSRQAKKFALFVAVRGTVHDGHQFIAQAESAGVVAIICEALPEKTQDDITYVEVGNAAEALGIIASNYFDNPSEKLRVVGVTGTNGKTTTATLLYKLTRAMGFKSGLLSTVENRIDQRILPSTHTTPDAITSNRLMEEMASAGCEFCFMEVSSHALDQHRVAGIRFAGAVFTNITHDHLDYHKTFAAYLKAKQTLFDGLPASAFALYNADDRNGKVMAQNTRAATRSYALERMADYRCRVVENTFAGLHLVIDGHDLYTRLIGGFNAYNLLAVYATAMELQLNQIEVLTALSTLDAPEGRFQYHKTASGITAVVDYAHSPDALKNILETLGELRTGNEQLITVVGCGGDRDREKRPVMARIAAEKSNRIILTSDNPRSEKPEEILGEMKAGLDPVLMKKTLSLADRREAIRIACTLANPGDIILVAGKGHEKYQEISGVKHPFDDFEITRELLTELQK